MKARVIAAVVAFVVAISGPAMAGDADYRFTVGTTAFVLPTPTGFCAARGRYDAQAKIAAAADHSNLTELAFYLCSEMDAEAAPTNWGYLKTPLPIAQAPARKDLIDYFKNKIDPADFRKMVEKGGAEANSNLRETLGKDLDVKLDIKPLDSDAVAVYWGGTIDTNEGGRIACAFAITVVNGYIFSLYFYRPYHGPADIVATMEQARAGNASFVAANGG